MADDDDGEAVEVVLPFAAVMGLVVAGMATLHLDDDGHLIIEVTEEGFAAAMALQNSQGTVH